jgi:hypothetical protein
VHQEGTFADVGTFTGTALEEVVDFWQDTNTKLGHVARALLSIPPSAAAPEVFFSLLGRPHVKGRAGMSAETACDIGHIKVGTLGGFATHDVLCAGCVTAAAVDGQRMECSCFRRWPVGRSHRPSLPGRSGTCATSPAASTVRPRCCQRLLALAALALLAGRALQGRAASATAPLLSGRRRGQLGGAVTVAQPSQGPRLFAATAQVPDPAQRAGPKS